MDTFDIKKERKDLYGGTVGEFVLLDVPVQQYLMVDGHGNPGTAAAYTEAVEALYSVSYTIRFAAKKQLERVHVVAPLEGLWWADDMDTFITRSKDDWDWTMMIHQPDWITQDLFDEAISTVAKKKALPALDAVRFESLTEGSCVQTLHIGSYDDEGPVLEHMHHEFMPEHRLTFAGKHHEIYLGDPRKVEAAKLKTLLRQPVVAVH